MAEDDRAEINGVECTLNEVRELVALPDNHGFQLLMRVFSEERKSALGKAVPRNLPEPDRKAKVVMPWEQFRAACERNTGRVYAFEDMLNIVPEARENFKEALAKT